MTPEEKLIHSKQWDGREERRRENRNQLFDMIAEMNEKLEKVISALPDGDAEGHRRYHESVIRNLERREKFRDAIIEKSIASLVWSMLVMFGYAMWAYVKDHVK